MDSVPSEIKKEKHKSLNIAYLSLNAVGVGFLQMQLAPQALILIQNLVISVKGQTTLKLYYALSPLGLLH